VADKTKRTSRLEIPDVRSLIKEPRRFKDSFGCEKDSDRMDATDCRFRNKKRDTAKIPDMGMSGKRQAAVSACISMGLGKKLSAIIAAKKAKKE